MAGGDLSWEFYKLDPFHILVNGSRASISVLIVCVFVIYMIVAAIFACSYLLVSGRCGLPDMTFVGTMLFSVETMLTIGYGVPGGDDALFRDCTSMLVLISVQSFVGVLLQTVLVGIVFVRMTRAQPRRHTILFSDKAVIRKIRGHLYFMFRVSELTSQQLVEAHVRFHSESIYRIKDTRTTTGTVLRHTPLERFYGYRSTCLVSELSHAIMPPRR